MRIGILNVSFIYALCLCLVWSGRLMEERKQYHLKIKSLSEELATLKKEIEWIQERHMLEVSRLSLSLLVSR